MTLEIAYDVLLRRSDGTIVSGCVTGRYDCGDVLTLSSGTYRVVQVLFESDEDPTLVCDELAIPFAA